MRVYFRLNYVGGISTVVMRNVADFVATSVAILNPWQATTVGRYFAAY